MVFIEVADTARSWICIGETFSRLENELLEEWGSPSTAPDEDEEVPGGICCTWALLKWGSRGCTCPREGASYLVSSRDIDGIPIGHLACSRSAAAA